VHRVQHGGFEGVRLWFANGERYKGHEDSLGT
jgi:hypothetical protein